MYVKSTEQERSCSLIPDHTIDDKFLTGQLKTSLPEKDHGFQIPSSLDIKRERKDNNEDANAESVLLQLA